MAKAVVQMVILSLSVSLIVSHEDGAPAVRSVCENLMPHSSSPHKQQPGNGGYNITLPVSLRLSSNGYFHYEAGVLYNG